MSITFVVEDGTGKTDATSYVSVEEAEDINSLNIHTADKWTALTTIQKQQLLMYCSTLLDARTRWNAYKTTSTQALEWPRTGVKDKYGNSISVNSVPYSVRMAVVEFAKWTAETDKLSNEWSDQTPEAIKVDSISIQFADASQVAQNQYRLPPLIIDLLRGFGTPRQGVSGIKFGKLVRV